jgi:flagellar hook assembly protein FlgD
LPPTQCKFSFADTTVTAKGRYAPSNVGAIWISDAQGKFVKTLEEWGGPVFNRIVNATAWETASGGNKVDAVTGATRSNHGPHTATWNCTDVSENVVPNGSYQVHVTFAESDALPFFAPTPIQASGNFATGAGSVEMDVPDTANFKSMHVSLQ